MIHRLRWLLVALISLQLLGCAKFMTAQEAAPEVNVPASLQAISLAVLDQRPYVLNKDKNPAFEGLVRSSFGIPTSYSTRNFEPMATFLGARLEQGFIRHGVDATHVTTNLSMSFSDLINTLSQDGKPSVVIALHEWKYDYHPLMDSSWYDVNVTVLDRLGNKVISKNFEGEDDIPGFMDLGNEMQMIYKARFEKIFSDPSISEALLQQKMQ